MRVPVLRLVALKNTEVWAWAFASPPVELGGGLADAEQRCTLDEVCLVNGDGVGAF